MKDNEGVKQPPLLEHYDSYDDFFWDDYTAHEEYKTNVPPLPEQPRWAEKFLDHRCDEMIEHECQRNANKRYNQKRYFVIKHTPDGWKLFDNNTPGMPIVQCPFCSQQMFIENQVTIE